MLAAAGVLCAASWPPSWPQLQSRVGDDAVPVLFTLRGAKNLREAFDVALAERRIFLRRCRWCPP